MTTATEIKLLTLLNVSAIKRPRDLDSPGGHRSPLASRAQSVAISNSVPGPEDDSAQQPSDKKRRKSVVFGGEIGPSGSAYSAKLSGKKKNKGKEKMLGADVEDVRVSQEALDELNLFEKDVDEDADELQSAAEADTFNTHFAPESSLLSTSDIDAVTKGEWVRSQSTLRGFGRVVEFQPPKLKDASFPSQEAKMRIVPSLVTALQASADLPLLTSTALGHLGSYKDFYLHSLDGEADGMEIKVLGDEREAMRKAVAVHAVNHVLKTRRKIIRNNERLTKATDQGDAIDPPRDQSFTRPKVLILLPFRSLALHYLSTHIFPLAPPGTQIENQRPFVASFSLPDEAGPDPLAAASAARTFPLDHISNFKGNSDDNFRFGIKFTRKAWRIVMMPANETKLLECDILVTSPLGFKMAAEREDSTDLLSSIEVCVVDGLDVMQMQNWDHVKFVFNHLNEIPKSPHGCDFSRVKPWYLDNQAKYLRQTILLSRYDSPEARGVFHKQCQNLAGKVRLEKTDYDGVMGRVKFGVRQVFERIDMEGGSAITPDAAINEIDQRLEWFTKKTLPGLLRSAVSRQNTLIMVPSYFDFVRVTDYLRKEGKISFAAISEYSSNAEISRARTMFFKGKKSFLIVTERFHFYRRYQLRGAKTLVFYSLPEHAQFYSEFLATPFIPSRNKKSDHEYDEDEVEVDEAEVTSRVLFSRFDLLRLERVVGSVDARKMIAGGEARYDFV